VVAAKDMNSFRTYLTELFEQPFTLHRVVNRGATLIQYQYRIDPKLDDTFENRANSIAVNFQLMGDTVGEVEWEIDFVRGGEVRRTGEGNASRVFATVLSAIRHFVGTHPADVLSFTAAKEHGSESRVRLYSSLVKRFAREAGYTLETSNQLNPRTHLFVLRKATP
jgi:hypothetical protein